VVEAERGDFFVSNLIPRSFIDDLLLRTDIIDVIGDRIRLRKAGKNYTALCPFHQEKTASFNVSPDKQFYHCFGCGKSGNAIGFLIDYEQLTFVEAVENLAQRVGLALPAQSVRAQKQSPQDNSIYDVLTDVASFYQSQLENHPKASLVKNYLKNRGISASVISTFQLGFAPPGWENVLQYATNKGYSLKQLVEAGVIIEKEDGKRYDRFRDRVMFPIRDHRGRTIAFGGRVLDDSTPKYLNSPETAVFHKSTELYGLFEARQAYSNLHSVILVEGYMDVIGLYQHGIKCGVATLGTAVSPTHFQRLFRYTDRVICCFDGDNAGRQAAWRALEASLPCLNATHSVSFLLLPEKEDPDSLIAKEGKEAFVNRLQRTVSLSDFLLTQLSSQHPVNSIDGRARFLQAVNPFLTKLNDAVLRTMLVEKIAELCRMNSADLEQLLTTLGKAPTHQSYSTMIKPAGRLTPMRLAISLLLQYPHCAKSVSAEEVNIITQWEMPGIAVLSKLLTLLHQNPQLTTAALLEHWREENNIAYLHQLASWPLTLPTDGVAEEFTGTLHRIKQLAFEKQIDFLLEKAKQHALSSEERSQLQMLLKQQAQEQAV
jgi:DNA primase